LADESAATVAVTAPSANPKRKHHHVPVFYTRAWIDPTQVKQVLWRYRPGQHPRPQGPQGVGYEDRFYDAPELPPELNKIEDDLMEMENIAAPHIAKLRRGEIETFTAQEKAELSTFLSILLTRTPLYREMVNTVLAQLHRISAKKTLREERGIEELVESNVRLGGERIEVERVREAMQSLADGNIVMEQTSKAWNIKEMFENAQKYDNLFVRMRWNLLESPAGEPFITSDNAVLLVDPARAIAKSPKEYKAPSFAAQLQFPVSPRYMLVGDFRGSNQKIVPMTATKVRGFNANMLRHSHKEAYASYRSDSLQRALDRRVREREPLIPTLPDDALD